MNFSSKCFASNVEEINSLLSFFKKFEKQQFWFFYCLIASNQMKCGNIYKNSAMRVGDNERRTDYEWPNILVSSDGIIIF